MPRKPTTTVRIDLDSHEQLRRLARQYAERWMTHVSVVDVVRIGITLATREILDEEKNDVR